MHSSLCWHVFDSNKYDEYIIVTRDHIGASLFEMIKYDPLGWKERKWLSNKMIKFNLFNH